MKYSIRAVLGSTLVCALLLNPVLFICNTTFGQQFLYVSYNLHNFAISVMMNREPEYWDTVMIGDKPHFGAAALAFVFFMIMWSAMIFWVGCLILEIFGFHTPVRWHLLTAKDKFKSWKKRKKQKNKLKNNYY